MCVCVVCMSDLLYIYIYIYIKQITHADYTYILINGVNFRLGQWFGFSFPANSYFCVIMLTV